MHWDDSKYAGFSEVQPWLKPTKQTEINVANELEHGEIFAYYQKLIRLRREFSIISEGDYQSFELNHPSVFAYIRTYQDQSSLVLNNFYGNDATILIPSKYTTETAKILINNYETNPELTTTLKLKPYQSIAILI